MMDTIITGIKQLTQYFSPDKPLQKQRKIELCNFLKQLQENGQPDIDDRELNELIEILNKNLINNEIKKHIKDKTETILNKLENSAIIVYTPEQNNQTVSDIADKLDNEIEQYNKYTKENPMLGVRLSKKENTWVIENKTYNIKTMNKNLANAIEIMKSKIILKGNNLKKIEEIPLVNFIAYKSKNIVIYNDLKESLYDIRHIIKLLDVDREDIKYNEFKNKITHYGFKQNQFSGYIIKEFMPEQAMFNLIMSSTSDFSKQFKNDVSKMLCQLRQQNMIIIQNDSLVLTTQSTEIQTKAVYNKKTLCDNDRRSDLDLVIYRSQYDQTYDNPVYSEYVKALIKNGTTISIQKYMEQHVLYFFIITLKDLNALNRIFCKIGYSADIIKRIKSLRCEYGCGIYLIGIKYIKSEQDEKKFHESVKLMMPHLSYPMQIGNNSKDEVYVFDKQLYKSFIDFHETVPHTINTSETDIHIEQYIKDQYDYFLAYLDAFTHFNFTEMILRATNLNEIQKDVINSRMTCLENDKKRTHELKLKDYELLLRDKDIKLKETDIRLKEIDNKNIELRIQFRRI